MDESYWMSQAQRRLVDAHALYRHRARTVTDDFAEVRYLWPDQRGSTFGSHHLDPQLESIDNAQIQLRAHVEAADAAVQSTIIAEDRGQKCQAALADFEVESQTTKRMNLAALDISGRVLTEAGQITGEANRLDISIGQLLT